MNDSFLRPLLRNVPETDWIVGLMILVSILYVTSRLLFPRYHSRINYAFFNHYEATKLIEEKNVLFTRAGSIVNIIPLFCIALIAFEQVGYFKPEFLLVNPFRNYLSVLALVIAFFGGRLLVIYLFGYAFEQKEVALRFNQIYLLMFENLGVFILVPSLILPFTAGIITLILLIVLSLALIFWVFYTLIWELQILKSYRISIFYMFLYLCTLEILPLWWVIRSITEGW